MTGYSRDPALTQRLLFALYDAMWANPDLRLGQLVEVATAMSDWAKSDVFDVFDEVLLEGLGRLSPHRTVHAPGYRASDYEETR